MILGGIVKVRGIVFSLLISSITFSSDAAQLQISQSYNKLFEHWANQLDLPVDTQKEEILDAIINDGYSVYVDDEVRLLFLISIEKVFAQNGISDVASIQDENKLQELSEQRTLSV